MEWNRTHLQISIKKGSVVHQKLLCSVDLRWTFLFIACTTYPCDQSAVETQKRAKIVKKESRENMQMEGGGEKNITWKEINVENIRRAVKRQRTPSDCRDLLPCSPALDINTIPDIIQVCSHVRILTVGVMISQAGTKIIATAACQKTWVNHITYWTATATCRQKPNKDRWKSTEIWNRSQGEHKAKQLFKHTTHTVIQF